MSDLFDKKIDMTRAIQDLALLYTQSHLKAKAENDEQFNPYLDPQGAMDYLLDTYFEAVGYLSGQTEEYTEALNKQFHPDAQDL